MYTGLNVIRSAEGLNDERLYPKGYLLTSSDLSLFLSFQFGGELILWDAFNIEVTNDLRILDAILERVNSTLTLPFVVNDLNKVSGQITLDLHVLTDGSGYSSGGDFYFERSHGI